MHGDSRFQILQRGYSSTNTAEAFIIGMMLAKPSLVHAGTLPVLSIPWRKAMHDLATSGNKQQLLALLQDIGINGDCCGGVCESILASAKSMCDRSLSLSLIQSVRTASAEYIQKLTSAFAQLVRLLETVTLENPDDTDGIQGDAP